MTTENAPQPHATAAPRIERIAAPVDPYLPLGAGESVARGARWSLLIARRPVAES